MSLDWILSPLTQYGVLALGLLSCLGLCLATSIRVGAERHRMKKSQEALDQSVTALSTAVEMVGREAREPALRSPVPREGLNFTKRAQALRMHGRGESLTAIAAALESPRNEIELLLKVHGCLN